MYSSKSGDSIEVAITQILRMIFENRQDGGKQLATRLIQYKKESPDIMALPRGGVPVGFEIAKVLHTPLSVLVVRKIGSPYNPEFGIGAIAEGNVWILDKPLIKELGLSEEEVMKIVTKETKELKRRIALYRNNKPLLARKNKTVILVDDGLATGITAQAAILAIKKYNPKQIIFASPVCASDTARELKHMVDTIICVITPCNFKAVGMWYRYFPQITDNEVIAFLKK